MSTAEFDRARERIGAEAYTQYVATDTSNLKELLDRATTQLTIISNMPSQLITPSIRNMYDHMVSAEIVIRELLVVRAAAEKQNTRLPSW